MRAFFGPATSLGHPFYPVGHEIPVEREIGSHEIFAFPKAWPDIGPSVAFDPPIDVVVVWDPMWLTSDQHERVYQTARDLDVPLVGVFGDWASGWYERMDYIGTRRSAPLYQAIVCDRAGRSVFRYMDYEVDVIVNDELLTYGRLMRRGKDPSIILDELQSHDHRTRPIDIIHIGYMHPHAVPLRAYMVDTVRELCEKHGWTYDIDNNIEWEHLEARMLRAKVAFNWSLGTTLNCRIYEAAAAGCILVSDLHNIDNIQVNDFARFAGTPMMLEVQLEHLLRRESKHMRSGMALEGAWWATRRSPMATWIRTFDMIEEWLSHRKN